MMWAATRTVTDPVRRHRLRRGTAAFDATRFASDHHGDIGHRPRIRGHQGDFGGLGHWRQPPRGGDKVRRVSIIAESECREVAEAHLALLVEGDGAVVNWAASLAAYHPPESLLEAGVFGSGEAGSVFAVAPAGLLLGLLGPRPDWWSCGLEEVAGAGVAMDRARDDGLGGSRSGSGNCRPSGSQKSMHAA